MSSGERKKNNLIDYRGSSKALRLLKTLTRTPAGNILYQQIAKILYDADHAQYRIVRAYSAMVITLIESYRRKLPKDSLLYLELKLIQKRLIPPISISELTAVYRYIQHAAGLVTELSDADDELIREALSPLLDRIDLAAHLPFTEHASKTQLNLSTEQHIDSVYRQKLDKQHRKMEQLQKQVTTKITEASHQYQDLNQLLKAVSTELQEVSDKQRLNKLREKMIRGVDQIMDKQTNFTHVLEETKQLLNRLNKNSRQLRQELDQVRVLSLTDDLTHLPNRRAFIRRLEDEINRSQRESSPLMLGILDLDFFKSINDKYGHNVGDEILQSYARDILSVFRHYDMVARYGGEEFAVILPNTDPEGALRAFNKVKNKAAGSYYRHEDTRLPLPSFSAGLAMHRPGESSREFIERVDMLLYKAKQSGRDRIEYEQAVPIGKEELTETVID